MLLSLSSIVIFSFSGTGTIYCDNYVVCQNTYISLSHENCFKVVSPLIYFSSYHIIVILLVKIARILLWHVLILVLCKLLWFLVNKLQTIIYTNLYPRSRTKSRFYVPSIYYKYYYVCITKVLRVLFQY